MKIWTKQEEGENLKRLLLGINQAEFARETQFPGGPSMISQNISGNRPMTLEAAAIYARYLKKPLNEISPRLAEVYESVKFLDVKSVDISKRLPVVGTAQLGDDVFFVELEYPVGFGDGYVEHISDDKDAFALQCKGESMRPRIKPNEFVIIEPNHNVVNGDEVLVKCVRGRVMVKELLYVRDNVIHLGSVNEKFPKITIPLNEVESMQYVSSIVKSSKWKPNI